MITRFFGIDTHKKYVMVAAVNVDQEIILKPTRISMADLPKWAAEQLTADDQVVLEVSSNTWSMVDLLSQHAGEVVAANPYQTKLIAEAHIKNDKVDATTLAKLLAARFIPEVWVPDRPGAPTTQLSDTPGHVAEAEHPGQKPPTSCAISPQPALS
jgi:transposase